MQFKNINRQRLPSEFHQKTELFVRKFVATVENKTGNVSVANTEGLWQTEAYSHQVREVNKYNYAE